MRTFSILVFAMLVLKSVLLSADEVMVAQGGDANWYFHPGSEFPGARGEFVVNAAGNGVLRYDFSEGGLYVSVNPTVDIPPTLPH